MLYALVDGIRTEPLKGLKGICEGCHGEVIAKCGSAKLHHWAHRSLSNCDSWWEPETEWHRKWKEEFPAQYREVVFRDGATNEMHRADIHTPTGVTIEFQNSPISLEELDSRDRFYRQIIWVVNAKGFKMLPVCNIPDPRSAVLNEFEFMADENGFGNHLIFHRKRDVHPEVHNPYLDRAEMLNISHPELKEAKQILEGSGSKYQMFTWKNKHAAWLTTMKPVFLDFGHDTLLWLRWRPQTTFGFIYIHRVSKADFIKKYTDSEMSHN